jgi:hypothetical protein
VPLPSMIGPAFKVAVVDDPPALMPERKPEPVRGLSLPDEWVLRELPLLDLDDPATYVSLWETYGPLVTLTSPGLLPRWSLFPDAIFDSQFMQPDLVRAGSAVNVTFIRHHFQLLRALVTHVRAYKDRRSLAGAWKSAPLKAPVENADAAREVFQEVMNAALSLFAVNVKVSARIPEDPRPFYALAVLQVFNIFVEGLPIRDCANENCQRSFQRQLGRAAKSQYRTSGVMFCSHQCADAQRQRDRRRQQRKGQR